MRTAPLFALLLIAACAPVLKPMPVPEPPPPPMAPIRLVHPSPVGSDSPESCAAKGGILERVGKLQALRCIATYADAGKACTDGSQCLGKRCTGDFEDKPASNSATGTCVATNNPFGCQTIIQAGVARTICVD